jgi:hypothetical protein
LRKLEEVVEVKKMNLALTINELSDESRKNNLETIRFSKNKLRHRKKNSK